LYRIGPYKLDVPEKQKKWRLLINLSYLSGNEYRLMFVSSRKGVAKEILKGIKTNPSIVKTQRRVPLDPPTEAARMIEPS
jgi:hypothetical protein